jgi:hypothetical protein
MTANSEDVKKLIKLIKVMDCEIHRFKFLSHIVDHVENILLQKNGAKIDFKKFLSYLAHKYGDQHPEVKDEWIAMNILREARENVQAQNNKG